MEVIIIIGILQIKSLMIIYATNNLPIDYIEIGYLSKPQKEYKGKFFI